MNVKARMSDNKGKGSNPYIPKYIVQKPWYRSNENGEEIENEDYLAHQRKTDEIIDYSMPVPGKGIKDECKTGSSEVIRKGEDYDSKRDRWYGFDMEEWIAVKDNWDKVKKRRLEEQNEREDSDDTDYELELIEFGLDENALKTNYKESPMEKMIRDRQDIPAYIRSISSAQKIQYDSQKGLPKDLGAYIINDGEQFIKKSDEVTDLKSIQKFAWDENEKYQQLVDSKKLADRIKNPNDSDDNDEQDTGVNVDLNLEANPTLMNKMMKERKEAEREKASQKKKSLVDRYGGQQFSNNDDTSGVRETGI